MYRKWKSSSDVIKIEIKLNICRTTIWLTRKKFFPSCKHHIFLSQLWALTSLQSKNSNWIGGRFQLEKNRSSQLSQNAYNSTINLIKFHSPAESVEQWHYFASSKLQFVVVFIRLLDFGVKFTREENFQCCAQTLHLRVKYGNYSSERYRTTDNRFTCNLPHSRHLSHPTQSIILEMLRNFSRKVDFNFSDSNPPVNISVSLKCVGNDLKWGTNFDARILTTCKDIQRTR